MNPNESEEELMCPECGGQLEYQNSRDIGSDDPLRERWKDSKRDQMEKIRASATLTESEKQGLLKSVASKKLMAVEACQQCGYVEFVESGRR
jgi:predicted nucleic-acid-binding Zn-ribbon protein